MEDVRRLQAVNGNSLCSALDLEGVGLVAPVEYPSWSDIQGLECSPEGPVPKNMRGTGQFLENER